MKPIVPAAALLLVVLSACAPPAPKVRGADLFARHCTSCHGRSGEGDGPQANDLAVQPANLTLLSERNGGVFPFEDVIAQVHGHTGRSAFGMMPEFGRDMSGPMVDYVAASGEVIATPQGLIDLARYLESIQQ